MSKTKWFASIVIESRSCELEAWQTETFINPGCPGVGAVCGNSGGANGGNGAGTKTINYRQGKTTMIQSQAANEEK